MKKFLLSLIAVLMGISMMAQNTNLKLNLEKNKVYRFKSISEQTITQTMNGIPQTTSVKSTTVFSIKMMDSKADFIVVEVHFDSINNETNSMGKISRMNSANEASIESSDNSDVMSCIMNRLSKNAIYVKMDYTGKVLEIINLKMLNGIVLKDTALIKSSTAPILKTQINSMVNEKAIKTMIETFTVNVPGKEVKKGDKWEISSSINTGGMALVAITNYNLEAVSGNTADISAESNVKAAENAEPMVYGGATIRYGDLKGLGKIKLSLNINTGLIIESTSKNHTGGNLNISAQGMNMQMPMELDGESKIIAIQ